jgi:hypothetical protein
MWLLLAIECKWQRRNVPRHQHHLQSVIPCRSGVQVADDAAGDAVHQPHDLPSPRFLRNHIPDSRFASWPSPANHAISLVVGWRLRPVAVFLGYVSEFSPNPRSYDAGFAGCTHGKAESTLRRSHTNGQTTKRLARSHLWHLVQTFRGDGTEKLLKSNSRSRFQLMVILRQVYLASQRQQCT